MFIVRSREQVGYHSSERLSGALFDRQPPKVEKVLLLAGSGTQVRIGAVPIGSEERFAGDSRGPEFGFEL
jgi:hypothetical protein